MLTRQPLPELETVEELIEHFAPLMSAEALALMVETFEPTPAADRMDRVVAAEGMLILELLVPHDTPRLVEQWGLADDHTEFLSVVDDTGVVYAKRYYRTIDIA